MDFFVHRLPRDWTRINPGSLVFFDPYDTLLITWHLNIFNQHVYFESTDSREIAITVYDWEFATESRSDQDPLVSFIT